MFHLFLISLHIHTQIFRRSSPPPVFYIYALSNFVVDYSSHLKAILSSVFWKVADRVLYFCYTFVDCVGLLSLKLRVTPDTIPFLSGLSSSHALPAFILPLFELSRIIRFPLPLFTINSCGPYVFGEDFCRGDTLV